MPVAMPAEGTLASTVDRFAKAIAWLSDSWGASLPTHFDSDALDPLSVRVPSRLVATQEVESDDGLSPSRHVRLYERIVRDRFERIVRGDAAWITPQGRSAEIRFWSQLGQPETFWLIERLAEPREIRVAWAVSDLLSALAPKSVVPMLRSLEGNPNDRQADALLNAFEIIEPESVAQQQRLARVIERYLGHHDDMVRIRAVNATAALCTTPALQLLRRARHAEIDPRVRAEIDEVMEQRGQA